MVIGDEAHLFKATSLKTLMEKTENAVMRFGTTGTLDDTKTHKLMLEGLFGPIRKFTTSKQLMKDGQLARLKITCLMLNYNDEVRQANKKLTYQEEMDFLVSYVPRNNFIRNLALEQKGNSLLLFQYVEKHGRILYDMIKEKAKNRKVFFVHGGVDADTRTFVPLLKKKEMRLLSQVTGLFSTGINIRNLHNIIFASLVNPKSEIYSLLVVVLG